MNEMHIENVLVALGLGLMVLYIVLVLLGCALSFVLDWIDDGEVVHSNWAVNATMRVYGYTLRQDWNKREIRRFESKNEFANSGAYVFATCFLAFLAPVVTFSLYKLWPLAIGGVILVIVAHLARFTKRHKKLFDKHVADKEAHKN